LPSPWQSGCRGTSAGKTEQNIYSIIENTTPARGSSPTGGWRSSGTNWDRIASEVENLYAVEARKIDMDDVGTELLGYMKESASVAA